MSHGKQFTLASSFRKVVIVLEELGLNYHSVYLDLLNGEHREPWFAKINPNGRIPALVDHQNEDFTIWESDAIMAYLVDMYDTGHKISVSEPKEKYLQLQWLFFQASGQGPYFGQAGWFIIFHPEKVPSAVERYQTEILRIWGVLESVLAEREWLVGDKCTVADLSFIPWNSAAFHVLMKDYPGFSLKSFKKDFPSVDRWHNAMMGREATTRSYALKDAVSKKA